MPQATFAIGQKVWTFSSLTSHSESLPALHPRVVAGFAGRSLLVVDEDTWNTLTQHPRGLGAVGEMPHSRVSRMGAFPRGLDDSVDKEAALLTAEMVRLHDAYIEARNLLLAFVDEHTTEAPSPPQPPTASA